MKRRLVKLRRLSWRDLFALAEAWGRLLLISVGVRAFPVYRKRLHEGSRAGIGDDPPSRASTGVWAEITRLHRLVGIAAGHHVYAAHCLERSLCLRSMLGARGIAAAVRIGVRRQGRDFEAHAWVEHGGEPVGESGDVDRRYAVFETAPRYG